MAQCCGLKNEMGHGRIASGYALACYGIQLGMFISYYSLHSSFNFT